MMIRIENLACSSLLGLHASGEWNDTCQWAGRRTYTCPWTESGITIRRIHQRNKTGLCFCIVGGVRYYIHPVVAEGPGWWGEVGVWREVWVRIYGVCHVLVIWWAAGCG